MEVAANFGENVTLVTALGNAEQYVDLRLFGNTAWA